MFIDAHTHNESIDNQCVIKIINHISHAFNKSGDEILPVSGFFSVGIHPWDANSFNDNVLKAITKIAQEKNIVAIGESGLDRAHDNNIENQRVAFVEMIKISEKLKKPMIIHSVKTHSDIIAIKKATKAAMPWVIHGFQGSVESAQQLLNHGMYISLGEVLYRNENQAIKLLQAIPLDKFFLETDVSERDIVDVYQKAAALSQYSVATIEKVIFNNFNSVFNNGKLEKQDTYTNR